jgi:ABC-type phosphate/phosphonate transport system substrate-binding protein
MRSDPSLRNEIAIIDVLGPSTIQPIAVTKRFSVAMRARIQKALTELHHDPGMQAHLEFGLIDRITAVDESAYDDIRQMLDECDAAGFMEIR